MSETKTLSFGAAVGRMPAWRPDIKLDGQNISSPHPPTSSPALIEHLVIGIHRQASTCLSPEVMVKPRQRTEFLISSEKIQ